MAEVLLDILKEYENLEYRIVEFNVHGTESYYIKNQLEMNRCVNTTHTYLTVYKVFTEEGKTYRGSYLAEIHPDSSREEITDIINEALEAAIFAKNEWYPLANPAPAKSSLIESDFEKTDVYEASARLKKALYSQDKYPERYLSYSEFNLKKTDIRIINSQGVDVCYTSYSAEIETAVNRQGNSGEIEIYESCKMSDCDTALLEEQVKRLFNIADKKILAQPTPALKDINILLTGECLKTFFSYYYKNACAENVYNNKSTFKIGDELQEAGTDCDKITMTLEPLLKGSTASKPWDMDGFPLEAVRIIEEGKLLRYWGSLRFSSLLGIAPTGQIDNFIVNGGSRTLAELKESPYLELVSFSDFQTDPVTGDFASEIRLGFYYDGQTTVPVTGGSISGNIKKVHNSMRMSLETCRYNNYSGPVTICIRNANVSGLNS